MPFQPLERPELIRIYRVDSGKNNTLENRNGGNLQGILNYLDFCEERLLGTGDYMSAFEVLVFEGYDDYLEFVQGKPRVHSSLSKATVKRVGKLCTGDSIWYSFPEGGAWKSLRKIGSLPVFNMYTYLRKQEISFMEQTFEQQAKYLEQLFQEHFLFR